MDFTEHAVQDDLPIPGSAEPLSPEETVERLRQLAARGVDLSLIQASLDRTPTERLLQMQELAGFIEMMQQAYQTQRHAGTGSEK